MSKENKVQIEINVTKIVKYVCFAAVFIVTVIFAEIGFKEFMKSPYYKNLKAN